MPKLKLELEYEFDFHLIGISCHQSNYKLAWLINQMLEFDLVRGTDLDSSTSKKSATAYYSIYSYDDEENFIAANLISNRSEKGFFAPEFKQLDYFLQLWLPDRDNAEEIMTKLKKNQHILACVLIDPDEIKSKHNFLF